MEDNQKRLFVAIPFDSEAKRGVKKILKQVERKHWPVKWEPIEKLHITLAFLGEIPGDKVPLVSRVVDQATKGLEGGIVGFKGLGVFPDFVFPKVIWLGLNGDLKQLAKIYKAVHRELHQTGFDLETRPFVPHVTLGRLRRRVRYKQRGVIGEELKKLRVMDVPQKLEVNQVRVFESLLKETGSEYQILSEHSLEASNP